MSRHVIKGFSDRHYIVVGWDPPLSTFFCQVFDRSTDEDEEIPVLWLGAKTGEVKNVAQLRVALKAFCDIPDSTASALAADQQAVDL